MEENNNLENQLQNSFWNKMFQFKFDLIYYSLHFTRCVNILRIIKYITTALTAVVTGIWMGWYSIKVVGIICGIIIVLLQALNALTDTFPYENRKIEIRDMTNELDRLYIKMENAWRRIANGELRLSDIRRLLQEYISEKAEIEKHYFKNDVLPEKAYIEKKANIKVQEYFNNLMGS